MVWDKVSRKAEELFGGCSQKQIHPFTIQSSVINGFYCIFFSLGWVRSLGIVWEGSDLTILEVVQVNFLYHHGRHWDCLNCQTSSLPPNISPWVKRRMPAINSHQHGKFFWIFYIYNIAPPKASYSQSLVLAIFCVEILR